MGCLRIILGQLKSKDRTASGDRHHLFAPGGEAHRIGPDHAAGILPPHLFACFGVEGEEVTFIAASEDEFARRGKALYQTNVLPELKPKDKGKYVAIDIETGDYEVDADQLAAADRLLERQPDAQIWYVRIGYRGVHHFGGNAIKEPL